jgi:hypothetical protein
MAGKRAWVFVLGLSLVASSTACTGSVCDRAESVSRALNDKGKACSGDGGLVSPTTFDKPTCEAGASACTAADLKILNSDFDCIDRVEACVAGNDNAWLGSLMSCAQGYDSVTPDCLHATLRQ